MKNVFVCIVSIFWASSISGQSSTKSLQSYSDLHVSGNIEVILKKSDKPTADITMINGDEKDVVFESNGNILKIYFEESQSGQWEKGGKAKIVLGYTDLSCIDVSASAKISSTEIIQTSAMDIDASSGANINISLESNNCEISANSGVIVTIQGKTDQAIINCSSGGRVDAGNFESNSSIVKASSGSSVDIHVNNTLTASSSSGASIKYTGNPANTTLDSGEWSGGAITKF